MYWVEKSFLFISDVHLGKISHFRKYGAAVPREAISKNFDLLDRTITFFKPKKMYFLGDLFHSYLNNEWIPFEAWVKRTSLKMILISGNHDLISPLKFATLGIQVLPESIINKFLFTHIPEERSGCFNIAGHIHPAVRLRGSARQGLRLPCFFRSQHQLILPAFGEFTGTYTLKPKENDTVYCITENEVFLIDSQL